MYFILKLVIFYATICQIIFASHPHFSVFRTENTFQCKTGSYLIPMIFWCNGHYDCPDRSDEADCERPSTLNPKDSPDSSSASTLSSLMRNSLRCPFGRASCSDGTSRCIPIMWFCDGDQDCPNNFDEEDCAYNLSSGENKSVKERLDEAPVNQSSIKFIVQVNSSPHYLSCNKFLMIALTSVTLKVISSMF